jgi:hypothetical protein
MSRNNRRGNPQYTTAIDDLPSLEDIESNGGGRYNQPGPSPEKYEKFIRNNYSPPRQSGMMESPPENYMYPLQPQMHMLQDHMAPKEIYDGSGEPSCIEVANHIANCPICSKFYNNDKTLYILTIVILAIFCILLLKKVLNV